MGGEEGVICDKVEMVIVSGVLLMASRLKSSVRCWSCGLASRNVSESSMVM